ncbi:MAG TPA: CAP domain-containing protein [Lachnospiraceae bacterium]|nr:CAP domain-containing protein [Lachnospiraceae bacterium]
MKRPILLGAAVLSSSALLLTPLTAQAASCPTIKMYSNSQSNSNCLSNNNCQSKIILSENSSFYIINGTNALKDFNNCVIGSITLPDFNCPNQDVNNSTNSDCGNGNSSQPNVDLPDTNQPETDSPIIPDTDVSTQPIEKQPEVEKPEIEKPEVEKPEVENPNSDNSGNSIPDQKESDTPTEVNTETGDTDTDQNNFIKQVVSLANIERAKYGLAPLTVEGNMEKAALVRSREIQTSFSHNRPDGSSFSTALKEAGVSYRQSGENIAWGQKTPTEVMNGWMNSSGHRANILNASYTRIGVGYTENLSGTGYWVQLFAN